MVAKTSERYLFSFPMFVFLQIIIKKKKEIEKLYEWIIISVKHS